jgi:hypothetical protein
MRLRPVIGIAALAMACAYTMPVASAEPPKQCGPQDGDQIQTFGAIGCEQAYDVAASYDVYGEKYQALGGFTCYSGTAEVAPTIFQCVSEKGEFAVSQS